MNDVGLGDYQIETNILTVFNFFVRLMINLCPTLNQIGFLLIYHYSGITLNEYKVMEKVQEILKFILIERLAPILFSEPVK